MAICNCNQRQIPNFFIVEVGPATNATCAFCSSAQGNFTLSWNGSTCAYYSLSPFGGPPCLGVNATIIEIWITFNASGSMDLKCQLTYSNAGVNESVIYEGFGYSDVVSAPTVLSQTSSTTTFCTFPSTVTLRPIYTAMGTETPRTATCIIASIPDVPFPFPGPSVPVTGSCAVADAPSPDESVPTCSSKAGLTESGCPCEKKSPCGTCGTGDDRLGPAESPGWAAKGAIDRLLPDLPGPAEVYLATNSMLIRLAPPKAGSFDPRPELVFNTRLSAASEFGCPSNHNSGSLAA